MTTPSHSSTSAQVPAGFETLIQDIRPELHRYCARMIGSVVDAEDLVQEALANLDLVNRTARQGRAAVGEYFHRYGQADDWQFGLGTIEGHPAILVYTRWGAAVSAGLFHLAHLGA